LEPITKSLDDGRPYNSSRDGFYLPRVCTMHLGHGKTIPQSYMQKTKTKKENYGNNRREMRDTEKNRERSKQLTCHADRGAERGGRGGETTAGEPELKRRCYSRGARPRIIIIIIACASLSRFRAPYHRNPKSLRPCCETPIQTKPKKQVLTRKTR
jgi:hypothetical protein